MKYFATIIFAIILSSCVPLPAQNTISFSFSDNDLGVGARYEHEWYKYGFYIGAGYGNYQCFEWGTMMNIRTSGGFVKYVRNNREDLITYFTAGGNYHWYHHVQDGYLEPGLNLYFPVSLEFGTGAIICKRFNVGWTYDPFKKDVVLSVGYRFGFKTR